ncbi:MAG TPA: hypothetical protein VJX30_20230 [Terriglobales bacterium]|nr:hypothetical protein [Terriglobales bacterium]
MKRALENRIAVVTGGSGAIGSAIIAGLERQGACAVSLDVARPAAEAAAFQDCHVREDNSEPVDVSAAVTFLCEPGAQQVTGQILRVDGGQSLGSV